MHGIWYQTDSFIFHSTQKQMHPKYMDFLQQSHPTVNLMYDRGTPVTLVEQHLHKQHT